MIVASWWYVAVACKSPGLGHWSTSQTESANGPEESIEDNGHTNEQTDHENEIILPALLLSSSICIVCRLARTRSIGRAMCELSNIPSVIYNDGCEMSNVSGGGII